MWSCWMCTLLLNSSIRIFFLSDKTTCCGKIKSVMWPSTITAVTSWFLAINQLLLWEIHFTLTHDQEIRLHNTDCTETPATSTFSLLLNMSCGLFKNPVDFNSTIWIRSYSSWARSRTWSRCRFLTIIIILIDFIITNPLISPPIIIPPILIILISFLLFIPITPPTITIISTPMITLPIIPIMIIIWWKVIIIIAIHWWPIPSPVWIVIYITINLLQVMIVNLPWVVELPILPGVVLL